MSPPRQGLIFVDAHADLMRELASAGIGLRLAMTVFMTRGKIWSEYVIDNLAIPSGKAKAVEMAVRSFARSRAVKDIPKWVAANTKRVDLLLEALHWPPRSEAADDLSRVFQHGPFKVHNTIHASGKDLESAKKTLDMALRAARRVDLPGFTAALRGDLYLVGQIGRKRWAAWYMPEKDAIYLRPKIRGVSPEESARHLVHELGHRYWSDDVPIEAMRAWWEHHNDMTHGVKATLPEVGEALPMEVNRKTVVVERYEGGYAYLAEAGAGTAVGRILNVKLWEWMKDAAVKGRYPTLYASTDAEEHFCEALSLQAFGKLGQEHLEVFQRIFQGSTVSNYRTAKANVTPVRQRTQYTCMSTSMMMCLQANGMDCTEDEVNKVMGARPMQGAAWEHALACAQHYGMRATLTSPCTVPQLKEWTDRGIPVMIAWNPEGREWSHASVVFDVVEDEEHGHLIHVADPNIPDPDETVRIVPKKEFYGKWAEKWPNYLVRRPAMAIEREITPDGRQVRASSNPLQQGAELKNAHTAARPGPHQNPWPQKRFDTRSLLNVLNDYADEHLFYVLFDDASEQQFIMVQQLRDAVKRGDRDRAKRLAESLQKGRSAISREIADFNPLWTWILDGGDFLDGRTAFESLSIPQWKSALSEHVAKFPKGEKMTVEEVAAVVGPEFKTMNEDPPESVKKVRERMESKQAALPSGTVEMFHRVLTSKLTQYDARLQKKQPNNYRLGHYLKAAEDAKSMVSGMLNRDDAEALEAYKKALCKAFTCRGGVPDLAPVRNVVKQIDAFLTSGDKPSLTRRARLSWQRRAAETAEDVRQICGFVSARAREAAVTAFEQDARIVSFLEQHASKDPAAALLHASLREIATSEQGKSIVGGKPATKLAFENVGLYGLAKPVVKLGMSICADLTDFAGGITWNLHSRKPHRHEYITAALGEHALEDAKLLLATYPSADVVPEVPETIEINKKFATQATQRRSTVSAPVVANTVEAWLAWDPSDLD